MTTATITEKIANLKKDNNTVKNRRVLYDAFLRTSPGTPERKAILKQMQFIVTSPTVIPAFKF